MKTIAAMFVLICSVSFAQTSKSVSHKAPEFMGVKLGVPLSKQFPVCTGDTFLPNGARCTDDGIWVRWDKEGAYPIKVASEPRSGGVWEISKQFNRWDYEIAKRDLIRKYGQPECDVITTEPDSTDFSRPCYWHTYWGVIELMWASSNNAEPVTVSAYSLERLAAIDRENKKHGIF